jgi:putative membrane protein
MTAFAPDPGLIAALALSAALYAAGVRRASRWPAPRTAAFALGLAATGAALMSGLDVYADRYLTVHMAEHMVLTLAAAPLLVAGAPLQLALRASDRPARARIARLLRAAAPLTHPAVAFALLPAALLATHLTPFYDFALRHPWAHALEHVLYTGAAISFWTPVIGAEPHAHRLSGFTRTAYLVASMPAMSALGAVLVSAQHPLYPTYARALGGSALSDQHVAGALMWVGSALVVVGFALAVAWRAWEREERRQEARERASYARVVAR